MNKVAGKLIEQAIEIEIRYRFQSLMVLWCSWNGKALSGDDFADEFGKLFRNETNKEWERRHPITCGGFKVNEANPLSKLLV